MYEQQLLRLQSMAVEEVYEVQNINDTSSLYGVLVRKQRLKEVKVLLEADHLFDNSRRIRPYSEVLKTINTLYFYKLNARMLRRMEDF